MDERKSRFVDAVQEDLHFSVRWVAVALFVTGFVFVTTSDPAMDMQRWLNVLSLATLFYCASVVIWLSNSWNAVAGKAGAVVAIAGLPLLAWVWLEMPMFVLVAAIAPALAVALFGVLGGVVSAISLSLLLALLIRVGVLTMGLTDVAVATMGMWGSVGLVIAMYRHVDSLATQRWMQYCQMGLLLEESRSRRLQLEQVTSDLMRANRQLELQSDKLDQSRLVAEEAQKSKSIFVAKVSHEFRTPLNMIIGLIDVVVETPEVYGGRLPAALLEDLEIVHRNGRHLADMINDVLDLSQAESGEAVLHRESVDLGREIEAAVAAVRPLIDKKGLTLRMAVGNDIPILYLDRIRIRQVILNLLSNAARFTERGGITIDVQVRDEKVVVSVEDTGPGISAEDTARIFDPFCQGSSEPWRQRQGSGLGLSISKQFVELHGGQIWLTTEPGTGSTFSFSLPVRLPGEPPTAGPGRWIGEDWVWTERVSRPQVLRLPLQQRIVVCDETGGLLAFLGRWAGDAELVPVRNLPEATAALRDCPAHAVVFNIANQESVLSQIAEAQRQVRDTPLLAVAFPPYLLNARRAGAVDYLIKPVIRDALLRALAGVGKPVERVLVVDDNPDVRRLLKRMLSTCPRIAEVMMAADGEQAFHELEERRPDVVLLDIVIPGMDGWQILQRLRSDEALCSIPVIMLSAQDLAMQAATSPFLVATMGMGLSAHKAWRCILDVASSLQKSG